MDEWDAVSTTADAPAAPPIPDIAEWDEVSQRTEPTTSQKITAIGQTGTREALTFGGAVSGMAMGAAIGTAGGPFAPLTVPAGAAVGAVGGYVSGRGAADILGGISYRKGGPAITARSEDLPPELRPYGHAGEVIGGSLPFAGAPLIAARMGGRLPASRVGNFINRIIDTAARYPGTFAASEAGGIAGSALASGIAETYYPGETGKRIGAEIVGGLFNPTRLIVGSARGAYGQLSRVLTSMSKTGRETAAGKYVLALVEAADENPEVIIRALRESGIVEGLTAGQKSGSPALIALEAKLISDSAKFGADAQAAAKDGLEAISGMIEVLQRTGDPAALRAAAEMRDMYFRTLLTGWVKTAERQAIEAASAITSDTPAARSALSKRSFELLDDSLKKAREAESELWNKLPDFDAPPEVLDRIFSKFGELKGQILPEESMPQVLEDFVERVSKEGTTFQELRLFRSRMLSLARKAASGAAPDSNEARMLGEMAEATLEVFDDIVKTRPSILAESGARIADYDAARVFSRELHDAFSRTFAGDALSSTRRGAERIPPELMMRRALATGREAGALRFREIEEAVSFLPKRGLGETGMIDEMLNIQERLVRLMADQAVNPQTGRVTPARLARIMKENEELVNRFPAVKENLEKAVKSEIAAADYTRLAKNASRAIEQKSAFAKIMKVEAATDSGRAEAVVRAVGSAINSADPAGQLRAMARLASRGGPDAVAGLQAAVYDNVIRRATDSSGNLSFGRLRQVLMEPPVPGQPSLIDILVKEGVSDKASVKRLQSLLSEAEKIEGAIELSSDIRALAAHIQEAVPDPGAISELALRIGGAKLGTLFSGGSGGHQLIAAGAGSKFARFVFGKLPQRRMKDVLIEAAKNPEFMALLLEKPRTAEEGFRWARQVHAYLLYAGISETEPE